jgi:hypothetical protein
MTAVCPCGAMEPSATGEPCLTCEHFCCADCGEWIAWEDGSADEHADLCDVCADAKRCVCGQTFGESHSCPIETVTCAGEAMHATGGDHPVFVHDYDARGFVP